MRLQNLIDFLATFGYLGKFPKAPGTVGTLGAIPIVFGLALFGQETYVVATLVISVLAIVVAHAFEKKHGGHDQPQIVIDEVAGYLVTMAVLPINWKTALVGFVLFRIFDILKPFPIGFLDKKIKGGVGVVVDDLAAGLCANIILQAMVMWQPQLLVTIEGGL